jgi:DNA-binding transcriptional regulator YiaG
MSKGEKVKERKRVAVFVYEGLGFPISLHNVPMVKVRGIWTPDIDYNQFQKQVLIALAHRPFPLTGDELQFIRNYFGLTLQAFALQFGISHVAVMKWERRKEKIAKIQPSTEMCVRLFILEKLNVSNDLFRSIFRSFDLSKIALIQKRKEREGRSDQLQGVFSPRGPSRVRIAV